MANQYDLNQEKSLLRWGGISAMTAGLFFISAFVFVIFFMPAEPAELNEWVTRFPEIKTIRTIENLLYLTALLFAVPLFLTLFMVLKQTHLASALFGCAMSLIGLTSMIISATPHVAHSKISDIQQSLELSVHEQESAALLWQSVWGIFDTGLYIGFLTFPIGFILVGIPMYKTATFGKVSGLTSQLLGIAACIAGLLQIIVPSSPFGAISYFSLIIFSIVFGIKIYKLSTV